MDSTRIKRLAIGVRASLRSEIDSKLGAILAEGSTERLDRPSDVKKIEDEIKSIGREDVIDKAAYTWFNRLCALRFMDANNYTPVGIVTPKDRSTQPEILQLATEGVFPTELDFAESVRQKVTGLLAGAISSSNPAEAAYAEILDAVCKRYATPMKYLFGSQLTSPLLVPQGLLMQDSLLKRIVAEMDAEVCQSVEVLGWLYQFYIAEKKDEVFASKAKRGASEIAPATQLFTPDWIVKYMTENSLGRLWMQNNPTSTLKNNWQYYIDSTDTNADTPHIRIYSPEEITVCERKMTTLIQQLAA